MFKAKKLFEAKKEEPLVYGVDRGYVEMLAQIPMTATEVMMRQNVHFSPYPFCDPKYIRYEIHRYDSRSDVRVEHCGLTGEKRQVLIPRNGYEDYDPRYHPQTSRGDKYYRERW